MVKKVLQYVFMDAGEFLIEVSSGKLYSFSKPHKFVGNIADFTSSHNDQQVQ